MLDSLKDPIKKSDELAVFFWLLFFRRVAGIGTFEAVLSVSDFTITPVGCSSLEPFGLAYGFLRVFLLNKLEKAVLKACC